MFVLLVHMVKTWLCIYKMWHSCCFMVKPFSFYVVGVLTNIEVYTSDLAICIPGWGRKTDEPQIWSQAIFVFARLSYSGRIAIWPPNWARFESNTLGGMLENEIINVSLYNYMRSLVAIRWCDLQVSFCNNFCIFRSTEPACCHCDYYDDDYYDDY